MIKKLALGPVMCDLRGLEISADEREMLMHPLTGGVILFARNYESSEQIAALTQSIHALRQPHLLVAVDHEGGRVQRFRDDFTPLPSCELIGHYGTLKQSCLMAEEVGWLMAAELLAVGVDLSFAPVLDIGGKVSAVIGDRAFHTSPERISELARAYMRGMKQAGMAAVGKHFPGHGSVSEDSHVAIPYDNRDPQDIQMNDMIPFERMIRAGMPGLMPAHVVYTKLDPLPVGFSRIWLKQILRLQLEFQGAIFSDDLSMVGAEAIGCYSERAEVAMQAGCDMVLICNNQDGVIEVLDKACIEHSAESRSRLIRMHGQFKQTLSELTQTDIWKKRSERIINMDKEPELNFGYDEYI